MRFTRIQAICGEKLPRWYGVSYYEGHLDCTVCHPIPFNLIVRWSRNFWWFLKGPAKKRTAIDQAYNDGYNKGRKFVYDCQKRDEERVLSMVRTLRNES